MAEPPPSVVFLAPESGVSGVGDHADDLVAALREHVDVVELRHGAVGADSLRDVLRFRRRVRDTVAGSAPGTVVHAELSGGAVQGFWSLWRLDAPRSVTIHDAPRPIWFPVLFRGLRRIKMLAGAVARFGSRPALAWERYVMRDVDVVVLSEAGADLTRRTGMGATVRTSHLVPPRRVEAPPLTERPRAVGLFGHVYRGKGFDLIDDIRAMLPADVAVHVAGRGTDTVRPRPGVHVAGAVEGADVDAWFASVRVVLLPYDRVPIGGVRARATSAVASQATAHGTPCVALSGPTMDELAADGGCDVAADLEALVARAVALVDDPIEGAEVVARAIERRERRDAEAAAAVYLDLWSGR